MIVSLCQILLCWLRFPMISSHCLGQPPVLIPVRIVTLEQFCCHILDAKSLVCEQYDQMIDRIRSFIY